MQQRYGMGFVLAILLSVSGCCCPMTCSPMMCAPVNCCPQVSWTEQMEDMYCDFSDKMHHQACHFKHKMTCTMRQLGAKLTPTCNCQNHAAPIAYGNEYAEMPVSAKVPPAAVVKERPHRGQRRRCNRCRQSPCRCGHCDGCDGFEASGESYPTNTPMPEAAGQQNPYEMLPPASSTPNLQEPMPVPPINSPNQGPTPIYKVPAPVNGPTASTSAATTTRVAAAPPVNRPPVNPSAVTPIASSIPVEEGYQLKAISFTTHEPLPQNDGWGPTSNTPRTK